MAQKRKEQLPPVKTKTDNQLPEWAKGLPEDTNFSIDFAHPDAPARRPGRTVSNKDVSLNDIQMFDVIHGKGVTALVDRRAPGRKQFKGTNIDEAPEGTEVSDDVETDEMKAKDSITENLRRVKEEPKQTENSQDEVPMGDLVLMIRGKVIGSGSLDDISEVILTLVSQHKDLGDDDIVLFQRVPLTLVLERVNAKY